MTDVRVVQNKLLGGWFVVRGPHQTPLGGKFETKAEAKAWLDTPPEARRALAKGQEANRAGLTLTDQPFMDPVRAKAWVTGWKLEQAMFEKTNASRPPPPAPLTWRI